MQKKSLRSAKDVVFFLFCILVDILEVGGGTMATTPAIPLATLLVFKVLYILIRLD